MVGLITHLHLINHLSRELAGKQWLKYDVEYREWAAAKGIRKWGDLNLTFYGRCLSFGARHVVAPTSSKSSSESLVARPKSVPGKRSKSSRQVTKACYQWNFDGGLRSDCRFPLVCFYCGDAHKADQCNSAKHSHKESTDMRPH